MYRKISFYLHFKEEGKRCIKIYISNKKKIKTTNKLNFNDAFLEP